MLEVRTVCWYHFETVSESLRILFEATQKRLIKSQKLFTKPEKFSESLSIVPETSLSLKKSQKVSELGNSWKVSESPVLYPHFLGQIGTLVYN